MATSLTTNLKLKIEDTLTSSARYNLERIDTLGNAFILTDTQNLDIRSPNAVNIRPNASESGGNGTGGTLNIGSASQMLTNFNAYALLSSFTGSVNVADTLFLQSGLYKAGLKAGSMSSNTTWTLPSTDGSNGQFLATDGNGQLNWVTPITGSNPEYLTTWTGGDGTSKLVTHSLGSTDIFISVKENSTGEFIHVSMQIINANQIQLTSSEAPGAGNWSVYVMAN